MDARRGPDFPTLIHYRDVPGSWLRRGVRDGTLIQVARGWYTAAADPAVPSWLEAERIARDRVTALSHTLGEGLVVTGPHAALLHGFRVLRYPDAVDVIGAAHASTTKRAGFDRRIVRRLDERDVCVVDGVLVTSPERTVIETARLHGPSAGLAVADALLRRAGEGAAEKVRRRLQWTVLYGTRVRGNPVARAVVAHADGGARTPLESEVRLLCLVLGAWRPKVGTTVRMRGTTLRPALTVSVRRGSGRYDVHIALDHDEWDASGAEADGGVVRSAVAWGRGQNMIRLDPHDVVRGDLTAVRQAILAAVPLGVHPFRGGVRELDQSAWARVHGA